MVRQKFVIRTIFFLILLSFSIFVLQFTFSGNYENRDVVFDRLNRILSRDTLGLANNSVSTQSLSGYSSPITIDNLEASYIGESTYDWSGSTFARLGDINNDNYDDFLIGAPGRNGGSEIGEAYLILGGSSGWNQDTDLSDVDASFRGEASGDQAGSAVAGIGDVNGDGFNDFAIGAEGNDEGTPGGGKVYIFFGNTFAWSGQQDLDEVHDASFVSNDLLGGLGMEIAGVGDVNNDGYDDFVITGTGEDMIHLVFGKPSGWDMETVLDNSNSTFIAADSASPYGYNVSRANINGDSYSDIVISSNFSGTLTPGSIYGIFGKATGWGQGVNLETQADFSINEEGSVGGDFGADSDSTGDYNGDGLTDILVSDEDVGAHGRAYIFFGKSSGWSLDQDASSADVVINGVNANRIGDDLANVGDINSDGYDDFILNDFGGHRASLFFGREIWHANMSINDADGFFDRDPSGRDIEAVSGVGDVDNDGDDDFIFGTKNDDTGGSFAGKSFLALDSVEQFQITNLDPELDAMLGQNNVEVGTNFGLVNRGRIEILQTSDQVLISSVFLGNLSSNLNWGSVEAEASLAEYKSRVSAMDTVAGTSASYNLYVPKGLAHNGVLLCSSPADLTAIVQGCSGELNKTEADPDTRIVTIEGQDYWEISGLSGSYGGYSYVLTTNTNQIAGVPSGLQPQDTSGNDISEGAANGLTGASETVRLVDTGSNAVVADIITDMSQDRDWSEANISADSDFAAGKVFVRNLQNAAGTTSSYTLYIPVIASVDRIRLCPSATSLAQVTSDCAGGSNIELPSTTNIGGQDYYAL
ncbi:MAG: integrin alpha, partial [Candidatus Dojkabacteria bacterium]